MVYRLPPRMSPCSEDLVRCAKMSVIQAGPDNSYYVALIQFLDWREYEKIIVSARKGLITWDPAPDVKSKIKTTFRHHGTVLRPFDPDRVRTATSTTTAINAAKYRISYGRCHHISSGGSCVLLKIV